MQYGLKEREVYGRGLIRNIFIDMLTQFLLAERFQTNETARPMVKCLKQEKAIWWARIAASLLLLVFVYANAGLFAEGRVRPVNIIMVVDYSGSMYEPAEAPLYLSLRQGIHQAIQNHVQINDTVLLIAGADRPSVIAYSRIAGPADKAEILRAVAGIQPDPGSFTDFGTWLEFALSEANQRFRASGSTTTEKIMLYLVTDGQNDPPQGSRYYRSDGQLPEELKTVTDQILAQNWSVSIIGVGRATGAETLANFLNTNHYELSTTSPGADFSDLVGSTLRNRVSVLPFTGPVLLRRGTRNSFSLNVLGGWDFGEVELQRATLTVPPQSNNTYDLDVSDGSFRLGPKESRRITVSFELPVDALPDTDEDKPIDGLLTLKFKEGAAAELSNPFIPFVIEHWFHRYLWPTITTTGLIVLFLLTGFFFRRRAFWFSVSIGDDTPEKRRATEGKTYSIGSVGTFRPLDSGRHLTTIQFRKKKQALLLMTGGVLMKDEKLLSSGTNLLGRGPFQLDGVQIDIRKTSGRSRATRTVSAASASGTGGDW